MACGKFGEGRLPDPEAILQEISKYFSHRRDKQRPASPKNLAGKHILITAGPTHEPIDPVRYIANRSEEHTSELRSLMRISYAVFCLKKTKNQHKSYNLSDTTKVHSQQTPTKNLFPSLDIYQATHIDT